MSASNPKNVQDAQLILTTALPDGSTGTSSAGIDLGHGTNGDFLADVEFLLTAPALTTTEQPDDKTLIYKVEHDTDSAFGTVATLISNLLTQTGAGAAGAAAATARFRVPTTVNRYIRVTATGSASGDSTTKSFIVAPQF